MKKPPVKYKLAPSESIEDRFGLTGEGQADIIERHLKGTQGKILNVGCGIRGYQIRNLALIGNVRIIAVDISSKAISIAKPYVDVHNVSFIVANAQGLPFEDGSVNHVVALGLFTYFAKDPLPVIRELHRICAPKGFLFITNSVASSKELHLKAGREAGFHLVTESEGACQAASGPIKSRYLLLFRKAS